MADLTTVQQGAETAFDAYKDANRKVLPFVKAYRADPEFRSRADEDPRAVLAEQDLELPPGVEALPRCEGKLYPYFDNNTEELVCIIRLVWC